MNDELQRNLNICVLLFGANFAVLPKSSGNSVARYNIEIEIILNLLRLKRNFHSLE